MKKYWVLLVLLFAGLYVIPAAFAPVNNPHSFVYLKTAINMLENGSWNISYPYTQDLLGTYVTLISIKALGITDFAIQIPMLLSVGLTVLLILLITYQCTHDSTIATAASIGFMCSLGIINVNMGSVNAFLPFALLGTLFMAYREDDLSVQRFFLLVASGILSGLVFFSYGAAIALLPLAMAVPFLLWEKRIKELFLMPWLVLITAAAVAYGLLCWVYPNIKGFEEFGKVVQLSLKMPWLWFDFSKWNVANSLVLLVIILLPMLLFIACVIKGYIGRKFLQLRIYRMSIISGIVFGILCILFHDRSELTWFNSAFLFCFVASLSILFAGGFVNYLRASTRHRILGIIFNTIAVLCAVFGTALATLQYIGLKKGMNILELDKKSVFILAGLLIIACVLIIGARKRAASIKTGIFLLVFTVLVSSCIVLRPAWGSLLPGNTTSGATDRTENTRIIGDVKNRLKVPAGQVTLWGEESLAELLPLARKLEAKKLVKINHYSSYNAGFFPVNAQAASINFAPLTAQELKELGLPAVIIVKTGTEVPEEIRQSASSIIRHRNRIAYIISK